MKKGPDLLDDGPIKMLCNAVVLRSVVNGEFLMNTPIPQK
jgi:hypothetical protein